MALNYLWIAFILLASIIAALRFFFTGDLEPLQAVVNSTFSSAKNGFEISLYLTGILSLWLGLMKVGEAGGAVNALSRLIAPLLRRLFPSVPRGHSAYGSMTMNIAANMLGLDNAATPMGLRAMRELQSLNKEESRASDAQIMFLVLNTSGLTLIPVSIMAYRQQCGAANPADVFLPLLITTFCSTIVGLVATAIAQRIRLWDKVVLAYILSLTAVIGALTFFLGQTSKETIEMVSIAFSSLTLLSIICAFLIGAIRKKINVYDTFIEGAKEGFQVAIGIVPFLIAILVGIGMLRASGAIDFLSDGLRWLVALCGADTRWVDAIPTALMRPLSGSGARGMMIETMQNFGADSFAGRLACILQGATDTTFYVLAVYFGSVGIKDTRNAVTLGLLADFAGIVAAILVAYLFFG